MADPFARMHDRLLALLGEEAFLRGTVQCNVNIEHGIAVTGEYGEVVAYRTLVYVPSVLLPKSGDTLLIGAKTWVLDGLESDDSYVSRFYVR